MTAERRRYYRIDDEVELAWQALAASELDRRLEDFWANEHAFSIRNNYNFEIEQHIADRNKIEAAMPELARYLKVLEQQIERLTERLIEDPDAGVLRRKPVSLSAQGIAFDDDAAPARGDLLELKLKLLPSGFRLVIIARVVLAETEPGQDPQQHRISLDFEHLHEADREILIKHMHGKQMEKLSSAREI